MIGFLSKNEKNLVFYIAKCSEFSIIKTIL